jgi:dCTP deaminase
MAALTKQQLKAEIEKGTIIISPLLDLEQIEHGSVNLRLGCDFIVPKRSQVTSIDPENTSSTSIQRFQHLTSVSFGGKFVLHPGELVLGATFEFIALPANRCGLVLSRSIYGRLGLLVATAVYVHPLWRGWLTLELVNTGTLPIELSAGSAVAQLVLNECQDVDIPDNHHIRPQIPVGPQFAAMSDRPEWKKLTAIRSFIEDRSEK